MRFCDTDFLRRWVFITSDGFFHNETSDILIKLMTRKWFNLRFVILFDALPAEKAYCTTKDIPILCCLKFRALRGKRLLILV